MRKILIITLMVLFVVGSLNICFAAEKEASQKGPAPNAGDGVPDGSGDLPGNNDEGEGPAPNAGDGIPDGSGF